MKIYHLSFFVVCAVFFLLSCSVFFAVTTKNRIRFLKDDIAQINSQIAFQQKLSKELETEFFLRSESTRVKELSDRYLDMSFTRAYQLLKLPDLSGNAKVS